MHLIVYSSKEGPATILRLIRLLSSCQPYSFSTDSKISVTVSSVTKLICSYSGSNQLLTKEEKKKITKLKTDNLKITSSPYLEPELSLIPDIHT